MIGRYFVRHKVSREVKAEAIRLYMDGMSLRALGRKFHVCKEAVRKWILKFEEAFAEKKLVQAKERDAILLDETKMKRDGRIVYVSACLDLARREVISIQCTRSISSLSTIRLTRESLDRCIGRNPIFIVDHAPWYKYAFESLGLEWLQITFGKRNYIERWYRTLKERTKRFFNNFPVRSEERALERIEGFLHLFGYWYNHMRVHETLKCTPSAVK
jgi:putative transposase